MKLGILILQYNSVEYTNQLAASIPEAIVIDAGSDPGKQFKGKNRTIRLKKNRGFVPNWNEGIRAVWDEFDSFWLMNNDIEISRDSVERVKHMAKSFDLFTPSYNCWATEIHNKGTGGMRDVGFMEFCAPVISKKVFTDIGLFDEAFSLGYGIEFDFLYQARQKGYRIYCDDGSYFYHFGHKTTGYLLGKSLADHEAIANREKNKVMIAKYGPGWEKKLFEGLNLGSDFGKITIYTTIFGDYTPLKPTVPQNVNVDWICITDNKLIKNPGWQVRQVQRPSRTLHPRYRAKWWKLHPWEVADGITIFIDGSIQVKSDMFAEHCIRNLQSDDLLLYKHMYRGNIQEEVTESMNLKKYKGAPLAEQVNSYLKAGYQDNCLYAGGIMVRRDTEQMRAIMRDWWAENIAWTYQDQLSLPVVLSRHNYKPKVFKEDIINDFFHIFWHDDGDKAPAQPDRGIKTEKKYKVSVIMPVKNDNIQEIRDAIRSLQRQTYQDFEVVIIDDNNGFGTREYLKLLTWDKLRIIQNKGTGLTAALNTGIEAAGGEILIRMDCDDLAKPLMIAEQVKMFNDEKINICGCQIQGFGAATFRTSHPWEVTRDTARLIQTCWITNHPGMAYRAEFIRKYMYNDIFPEDFELWCRILRDGNIIYNNQQVLIDYRAKSGQKGNGYLKTLEKLRLTL